jgi:hypothetical protein
MFNKTLACMWEAFSHALIPTGQHLHSIPYLLWHLHMRQNLNLRYY